ncbi:MAG: arsenic transporter [Sutterella sp.]|nr:arsenic transporter [Sutterella sp.]
MWLAVCIFLFTMVLVIWQPKGLNIGWSASLGAVIALLTGVVSLADIPAVWHIVWNATSTLIAIIIINLLLDEAGFFEWAALHVARWGKGNGYRLFAYIVLFGAVMSALFANDGAVLILTPILMAMLSALQFDKRATIAFVMAAGFISDTGSIPLVVSNLVNILTADFFGLGFSDYASVMVPVNVASVLASLLVLLLFYRRAIPAHYAVENLKNPREVIKDPLTFKAGWLVLFLLLVAFYVFEPMGVPVSVIAGLGALLLLAVAQVRGKIATRNVLRHAPWHIVIFSIGMYLVVYGLRNAGLTNAIAGLLNTLAQEGLYVATVGTGFLTALLSSVMNNLPSVLVGALSIDASTTTGVIREGMIYANIIGCDLGPKITPIGSLATLLWLFVLSKKHLTITWGEYFRAGIVLTLPVLLVTLSALVWRLS